MTTPAYPRDERIGLRLSSELEVLLTRAASYSLMSLSSFWVSVASDRAKAVVAEHESATLTARDWEAFVAALDDAERPRPQLQAAARRYRERRKIRDADRLARCPPE